MNSNLTIKLGDIIVSYEHILYIHKETIDPGAYNDLVDIFTVTLSNGEKIETSDIDLSDFTKLYDYMSDNALE